MLYYGAFFVISLANPMRKSIAYYTVTFGAIQVCRFTCKHPYLRSVHESKIDLNASLFVYFILEIYNRRPSIRIRPVYHF